MRSWQPLGVQGDGSPGLPAWSTAARSRSISECPSFLFSGCPSRYSLRIGCPRISRRFPPSGRKESLFLDQCPGWRLPAGAILRDGAGASCSKLSQGFGRAVPALFGIPFSGGACVCLAHARKSLEMGIAYGLRAGTGSALTLGIAPIQAGRSESEGVVATLIRAASSRAPFCAARKRARRPGRLRRRAWQKGFGARSPARDGRRRPRRKRRRFRCRRG